jgi:pimeloyl-ACP methyl ester carboxylesterase
MKRRVSHLLLPILALAASIESVSLGPLPLAAQAPAAAGLELSPCHIDGLAEEILCGTHTVFEDRDRSAGRTIPIHVAVLPSLRRPAEADPLFLMHGGPGQGARALAQTAARFFRGVRRQRDIVLVDLRGTGKSSPLACDTSGDEIAALEDADFARMARDCAAMLDADPRLYTHHNSLADLDEIRQRLGYQRINLWGGSWGTRASLLYALRYPESTRSVVLDGAAALTMEFPRFASPDAQAALDRLVERCAADADCHQTFPDARAEIDRFLARFTNGQVTVALRHPRTHTPETVTLSMGLAADALRGALYTPRDAASVLHLVRQAANGDFAPLLAQFMRTSSVTTDDMALGATFSVLCSEDLPRVAGGDVSGPARGSIFGTTYADIWTIRCAAWKAGPALDEPAGATSQVPALILSGGDDPVTPPRAGELMAKHFTNARHIVVPRAAHNTSFSGCVPDLIARFIADAGGEALDPACVNDIVGWPFVLSTSGSRP